MVKIDLERCEGRSDCVEQCPMGGFQIVDGKSQAVNEEKCIECRLCETVFPKLAITVTKNDNPEKIFSQTIRTDLFKPQTGSGILPLPVCHFCGLLRIITQYPPDQQLFQKANSPVTGLEIKSIFSVIVSSHSRVKTVILALERRTSGCPNISI